MALASSATLRHRVGCNGFFTALLRVARIRTGCRLSEWWSAWQCAAEWGELARTDGYGVWHEDGTRVPFIIEYDRGTESGPRLAEKLSGYTTLLRVAVSPTSLLFCFESSRREIEARRALAGAPRECATGVLSGGQSPADAMWLTLAGAQRMRLVELRQALERAG
jgi:hypothetical protein